MSVASAAPTLCDPLSKRRGALPVLATLFSAPPSRIHEGGAPASPGSQATGRRGRPWTFEQASPYPRQAKSMTTRRGERGRVGVIFAGPPARHPGLPFLRVSAPRRLGPRKRQVSPRKQSHNQSGGNRGETVGSPKGGNSNPPVDILSPSGRQSASGTQKQAPLTILDRNTFSRKGEQTRSDWQLNGSTTPKNTKQKEPKK
jgi:hypothetical protein